ncbi:MarR family transcriptional regulator [Fodinisporobacter ferrooxydans]|uniref:MarR family transcriptional regulator n=1 Tax=Fodinisporobacter ferrooxydans TaxID=2901836 RepID=A0ABY4CGK3_9BACL|nr:MarR family transcriptional regulator [Alicyclobacillaceae bacterium MYW30-H2]
MEDQELLQLFLTDLQVINRYLRSNVFDPNERPITRVQWLLLRYIDKNCGCTIGELANYVDVRSSTMSQMIDRLEKNGLVYRECGKEDARIKKVYLHDKGLALIKRMKSLYIKSLAEPFESFSNEEKETFIGLMEKFVRHIPRKKGDQT